METEMETERETERERDARSGSMSRPDAVDENDGVVSHHFTPVPFPFQATPGILIRLVGGAHSGAKT